MEFKNGLKISFVLSICTQIFQSIILGIWLAQKYNNPNYYFLLLDVLLLFALLINPNNQFKTLPVVLFTVILSIEIHLPNFDLVTSYHFYNQVTLLFIMTKIHLNNFMFQQYQAIIIYFLIIYFYIFIRLNFFRNPHFYLSLVFIPLIIFNRFVKFIHFILIKLFQKDINNLQKKVLTQQGKISSLVKFFEELLPFPICVTNQQENILFLSQTFRNLYYQLTPSLFQYIISTEQDERVNIYLPNNKPAEEKVSDFQLISKKEYKNCVLDQEALALNNINQSDNLTSIFPLKLHVADCFWDGQYSIILILGSQDEKQMENKITELTKQDEYKNYLLASVSHDFKTPINGMVAIIEYLEGYCTDSNFSYYLRIVKKNAFLLLFMIQDILDFSRIQKNQLKLNHTKFQIKDIVQEVIELIKIQAQQKGIKIQESYPNQSMYSDPNRIKQILLNLLSNSLKFTEKGYIDITITSNDDTENESHGSEHQLKSIKSFSNIPIYEKSIRVVVTDTGVGIPNNVKPKLFNLYATFDYGNGTNRHGIGLGLVICKKLVGMLGPTPEIQIESQVGVGTKFTFYLNINNEGKSENEAKYLQNHHQIEDQFQKNTVNQRYQTSSQVTIFQKPVLSSGIQQKKLMIKKNFTAFELRSTQKLKNVIGKKGKSGPATLQDELVAEEEDIKNSKAGNIQLFESRKKIVKKFKENAINFNSSSDMHKVPSIRVNNAFKQQESSEFGEIKNNSSEIVDDSEEEIKRLEQNRLNLLIVDDQAFNVMALKLLLNNFNAFFIDEAFNGEQAINKVKERASEMKYYDYIFMDLTMPIMDGYMATKQLKYMVQIMQIPMVQIIALTGYDDEKEKEKCFEFGFDAFISKPVKYDDLATVLKEFSNKEQ